MCAPSRRRASLAFAVLALAGALLAAARAGAVVVAGFGDSLTWAPGYLAQLPPEWSTLNLSQGGECSWEGRTRLEALLPALGADVVVVMEGTNDVRAAGYTLERTIESLTAMADALRAKGHAVVLVAPPPLLPFDPAAPADATNARLIALADALALEAGRRRIPFVDLFAEFVRLAPLADYYLDGIHPNERGSAEIAQAVEPAIARALARPGAGAPRSSALGALMRALGRMFGRSTRDAESGL
jgi:lysophospholipase L1-like esterase